MGLDFIVYNIGGTQLRNIRIGSYSLFDGYRHILAVNFGIDLDNMVGFKENKFEFTKYIPFKELLSHSDCDGELNHSECVCLLKDFNTYTELSLFEYSEIHKTIEKAIRRTCKNGGKIVFS